MDPRQTILRATTTCLEQYGIDATTVRRIAATAGVNLAAINYYFGSKNRLVEAALAKATEARYATTLAELAAAIASARGDIRRGTDAFFQNYLAAAFQRPNTACAILRDALTRQDYAGPPVQELRRFVEGFERSIASAMPEPTQPARRAAVLHVWATVQNLAMLPELFANLSPAKELPERIRAPLMASLFGRLPGAGFTRIE